MKDQDSKKLEELYKKNAAKSYFGFFAEYFCSDDEKKPLDYILEADDFHQIGRFTVIAHKKIWKAEMTEESTNKNKEYFELLTENPDAVIGLDQKQYYRNQYQNVVVFISDKESNGLFYAKFEDFSGHSFLIREILINKNKSKKVKILGKPDGRRLDIMRSGIVLPKQEGIDNSYVSLWGDYTDNKLNDLLLKLVTKLKVPTPVYMEYIDNDFESGSNQFKSAGHILLKK